MRSPFGARFPSRSAALALVAALTACTGGAPPAPEPGHPGSVLPRETAAEDSGDAHDERSGSGTGRAMDSVVVIDGDSRRTVRGEAPPYVEIRSAEVVGAPDELSLRMTLAGDLPARIPDDHSVLRVSFMITTKDGRRFTFDAQCVRAGWGALATGGPKEAPPPDLVMSDHGGTIAVSADPSYIGGLTPDDWMGSVA